VADQGDDDFRAAIAQQLLQMRPRDLLLQTAVMLANQAAIRLGMGGAEHVDRTQAREAIDAFAGLVDLLEPLVEASEHAGLKRELAQLRMAFVQVEQEPPPAAGEEPPAAEPGAGEPPAGEPPADEPPAGERPPIWTPRGEV
jgi:hypothetical protein